jgi:hypothetical protein
MATRQYYPFLNTVRYVDKLALKQKFSVGRADLTEGTYILPVRVHKYNLHFASRCSQIQLTFCQSVLTNTTYIFPVRAHKYNLILPVRAHKYNLHFASPCSQIQLNFASPCSQIHLTVLKHKLKKIGRINLNLTKDFLKWHFLHCTAFVIIIHHHFVGKTSFFITGHVHVKS